MDKYYNQSRTMVQLGIKVNDPKLVPEFVEKLKSSVVGLHVSTTPTHFLRQTRDPPTVSLPENLSIQDCCKFIYENHSPNFSERLASIGANRDTIVLNCGHICADGRYLIGILQRLLDPKFKPAESSFPADVEQIFEKELKTYDQPIEHFFVDPTLTRVLPRRPVTKTYLHCPYVFLSSPVQEFQCYDARTGRVHGLTEALWTCSVLSANAFNNRISQSGVASCIDMREFTPSAKADWSLCNYYSNINVSAGLSADQSIRELGSAMRRDFKAKLENGFHYAFFKSLTNEAPGRALPGIGLELSNMGPVKVREPIVDAYIRSSISDQTGEPFLSFSTFSVVNSKSNIWRANVRYRSALIDRRDAEAVAQGALFAMKQLPDTTSVGEAVREIQKFQARFSE